MAGWNADTAAGPLVPGAVTLVEGSLFCISWPNGGIHLEYPHGVFVQNTRMRVSRTQQALTHEATYEDEVPCVIPGRQARAGSGSGTPFLLQPG